MRCVRIIRPTLVTLMVLCSFVLGACGGLEVGLERQPERSPTRAVRIGDVTARTEAESRAPATEAAQRPGPAGTATPAAEPSPIATETAQPGIGQPQTPLPMGTVAEQDASAVADSERLYRQLLGRFGAPDPARAASPERVYEQRLDRLAEDYARCGFDPPEIDDTCRKPESLERDLKPNVNIELILDASGSMRGAAGGERKIDIAKRVLTDFIRTLPKEANVALRVYGHLGSNAEADKRESCAGSELIYPFQRLDAARFAGAIDRFEARGWTPVAGSLRAAKADFAEFDPETSSNFVYLVSDGVETCGGDPVTAARELAAEDIQAEVNIIGFDVDPAAARQLRAAARSGGGSYYEARNAAEFEEIFRENYDWASWSLYYACKYAAYWEYYGAVYNESWGGYSCVYNTAYREYANLYSAANTAYTEAYNAAQRLYLNVRNELYGDERYEPYREDVGRRAAALRDELIAAAEETRDYTVAQARERRDGFIEAARYRRDTSIERARETRERELDEAAEDRDEGRGNED